MLDWFRISIAQIGISATFYYLADRILRKIGIGSVYPYYFFSQPLNNNNISVRLSRKYHVKEIEPNNPDLLKILSKSVCEARFQQDAICIGAYKEDTLTALLWFTPGLYHEDEVRADFIPPKRGCWDFGVHIEPEYRMTMVFYNLWISSTQIMQDMDFCNSFSRISAFNPSSLKSHARLGSKLLAKTIFFNIGPIQISFSNIKPLLHISCTDRSRLVLRF